jgi:mannose-6-phosphate isomerase-like protein (cupin superfamily)
MPMLRLRVAVIIIFVLILTSCAGPRDQVVMTDNKQHSRDYKIHHGITPVMPEVISENHMPWFRVSDDLRYKVYFNDRQTLVLNEWTKTDQGKDTVLQYHVNELTGYVIEGNLMVTINKQAHSIGPGGVFIIPSNVHYCLLPLTTKVVYLAVFTPARDDLRRFIPPVRFDENDIKSLIYKWFSYLDKMADGDTLMPFLADKTVTLRFSGVLFKTREDFKTWYSANLKKIKSVKNKVEQIQVEVDQNNNYIATIIVSRQITTIMDEELSYESRQAWVFSDQGGVSPVITYMDVNENIDAFR